MPDRPLRLCPDCGKRTIEEDCPNDGNPTVLVRKFDPDAVVRPGDIVAGRYRVEGALGGGGYGAVLAAVQVVTGQAIALKVLKCEFTGPSDATVRRFFREARVTAGLSHPNTIRVFDVGQTEAGAFYIAMERLNGPSLEDAVQLRQRGGAVMTEPEAIDVAVPILRSLAEAHEHKLVHRDMKPANIVLAKLDDGEVVVKVLDFGIALTVGSSLTTAGMALGTPAYMSPEQCEAIAVDGRSDLYSLGIILYRAVTGDVPFADRNPITIMQDHLGKAPPDLRSRAMTPLSNGFVTVVARALAKERDDRYATAAEMRHALEAVRRSVWLHVPPTLAGLARGDMAKLDVVPIPLPPHHETALAKAAVPRTRRGRAVMPQTSGAPVGSETALVPAMARRSRRMMPALLDLPAVAEVTSRESLPAVLSEATTQRLKQQHRGSEADS